MTVEELIAKLQSLPPKIQVFVEGEDGFFQIRGMDTDTTETAVLLFQGEEVFVGED